MWYIIHLGSSLAAQLAQAKLSYLNRCQSTRKYLHPLSPYSFEKKLQVASEYFAAQRANGGNHPNFSYLGNKCNVSRTFIRKIHEEYCQYGRILRPREIRDNKNITYGPGSRLMNEINHFVVLFMYLKEPS